jgi:hypothetical protein
MLPWQILHKHTNFTIVNMFCLKWTSLPSMWYCSDKSINDSIYIYIHFLYICCIQVYCHVFILYQNIKVLLKKTVSIWSKTPEFLPNSYYIYESLFDMVPMDVLHACQFLDIIHLYLKHDFWQVKTFILSFLTKKI